MVAYVHIRGWAIILVDNQAGSKDLFPRIRALTSDVVLTRIEPAFGDVAWDGRGPDDTTIRVGIEYKTIDDVLDCVSSGRFGGHQAIGMTQCYDRRFLLVEGYTRVDRSTGILQKWNWSDKKWRNIVKAGREFLYRDLLHWTTTFEEQAQFRVIYTTDDHESARWVFAKYTWYAQDWDDHTALKQFYVPPPPNVILYEPTFMCRVAKELYKIGWTKALEVEKAFKSVREMINANEQAWLKIPGIGKLIASQIVAEINKENK